MKKKRKHFLLYKFLIKIASLLDGSLGSKVRNALSKLFPFIERTGTFFLGKAYTPGNQEELRQAASLLENRETTLCIDIGGNVGNYTQAILEWFPHASVVVFEPQKFNQDELHNRFRSNNNVTIEPYAISNTQGSAELFTDKSGSSAGTLSEVHKDYVNICYKKIITLDTVETVTTIKFEDYWKSKLNKQQIGICKLDIEGHEWKALGGFGDALQHIEVIQFEFGCAGTHPPFLEFWSFFKERNFDLYRIAPLGPMPVRKYTSWHECFVTTNYLAKRKPI